VTRIPVVPAGELSAYYRVTDELVRTALRDGRSYVTGEQLWTADNARELRARVIETPDKSAPSFDDKLQLELEEAPDGLRLFAAELRLLHLLPIVDMAAAKKRGRIERLLPIGVQLPDEVAPALELGVARWGAGHAQAWHQYSYLIRVVEALGELDPGERAATVDDPWRFKGLLNSLEMFAAQMEREALLFVAHPDTYDAVFNGAHKDAIVRAFQEYAPGIENRDRALLAIREALTPEFGEHFNWYGEDLLERWKEERASTSASADSSDALPPVPESETERRRLRVACWVDHLTTGYRADGRQAELEHPREDVAARVAGLQDELLAGREPNQAYLDAMGDDDVTASLRRGSQRVFVAGFFREGGAEAVQTLAETLLPPADLTEAEGSLQRVYALADRIGTPRAPTPSVATLLLPSLWSLQAPDRYAPYWWAKQYRVLEQLGWVRTTDDWVERYLEHQRCLASLTDDLWAAGHAVSGVAGERFLGLDPTLGRRAEENVEAAASWRAGEGYLDVTWEPRAVANAQALVGELRNAVSGLTPAIEEVLDTKIRPAFPRLTLTESSAYRGDAYVAFSPPGSRDGGSFRLWVTADSLRVGAVIPSGVVPPAGDLDVAWILPDVDAARTRFEPAGHGDDGRRFVGRRYELTEALDNPEFLDEVVEVARKVIGPLRQAWGLPGGAAASEDAPRAASGELETWVQRWQAETRYPTPGERDELDHLEELTRRLAPARLEALDRDALRELAAAPQHGIAPNAEEFVRELRTAAGATLDRLGRTVRHLLWSGAPLSQRFDDVHGHASGLGFPGLSTSLLRRLLSRAPDGWLPILDFDELQSHADRLGIEAHVDASSSLGQRQAAYDAALQQRLEPWFGTDTAALAAFLRWHASGPSVDVDEVDVIEQAADELYVPTSWLRTVEELLRDKGQLIFYGPPGTGKTFIARRLAEALTATDDDRWLVQFHPSTSYEDFFEGFRPVTDDERGQLSYTLTEGPLARAARHAAANPGRTHVLIIDEINRANLPRVFGELLFLLEYRDASIHTLYRSERPFRLPSNLLVIGTMNTADRSIAMIDAALRRRFHFVPLFPHEPPLDELLARWGVDHGLDRRWVELLAMVNRELAEDLGGPDLQVGPSHFMREDLDAETATRIWNFSVFPYIEDQLFGRPDRIRRYGWEQVNSRLDKELGRLADQPDGGVEPDGPAR
jgi:5-methylcytosine-specific restriction protein B